MKLQKSIDLKTNLDLEKRAELESIIKMNETYNSLKIKTDLEQERYRLWKEETIGILQKEIDDKIEEKNSLSVEVDTLSIKKKSLLEPLDKEWKDLEVFQILFSDSQNNLKKKEKELNEEKKKVEENLKNSKEENERIKLLVKEAENKLKVAEDNNRQSLQNVADANKEVNKIILTAKEKEKEVSKLIEENKILKKQNLNKEKELREKEEEINEKERRLNVKTLVFEKNLEKYKLNE